MQELIKLKKALFGFSKASVLEYINGVSKSIDDKLFLKENEILKYKKEIEGLKSDIESLKKTISDFEDEKTKISQMYINAENRAEVIVKDAEEKASQLLAEADEKIKKEREDYLIERDKIRVKAEAELDKTRALHSELKLEITALQSRIKATLNKFDSLLEDINK